MSHEYRQRESQEKEPKDWRVIATQTIWSMAAGMLALTFVLEMLTRAGFGPAILIVLTGSILGTATVWGIGRKTKRDPSAGLAAAQQRLHELEERLANVETITVFERRLAEETAARQSTVHQSVPERESVTV